jgi:cation diffusion facilitator family transporter
MAADPEQLGRAEARALIISAAANACIGVVGLVFAAITASQAIMLDALFNLVYFGTALFTLRVARLVWKGDDDRFPYGYAFFEPLVNGLKGVLVLGVSLVALAGAVQALFGGGRMIAAGMAVTYGIVATTFCGVTALATRHGARRSGSPLVRADAENWTVNTAISSCVLVAFGAIFLIRGTRLDGLVPYVDPLVVITLILITIGVPVRMARQAVMELLNRAPPPEIVEQVTRIIERATAELPVQDLYVRMIQPGRTRMVTAHVVLPDDARIEGIAALDGVRAKTLERLQSEYAATILDMVFTTDPAWGKPTSLSPT